MKKRLFAIMLALAMLLAAVPALAEEGGEALETAAKKICKACKKEVESVDANGLCAKCALEQNNTQQIAVRSPEAPVTDTTGGGEAGGTTGGTEGNTDDNTGDNTGNNTVNTDNTGGNTGTNVGQNPPTGDGEGGGNKETCEHEWGNPKDADKNDSKHYCYMHKKTCSKCKAEVWESHEWNRANQKMVKESTCTEPGKDELPCTLCNHVTYVSRELKPHTKDKGTVIKPATCTEKGTMKYNCTVCGNELLEEIPALGHSYGAPVWNWYGFTSASATFTCTRNCGNSVTQAASIVRSSINNCGYYTYTATVRFNDKTYTDTRTDYSCRPDWYYDPCYYNNPCGHWGCGNVCTRYSDCVPCRDYRTTFRVGGYNCLATPKTGDVSVLAPAMLALIGAAGAMLGKKRR